MFDIEPSVEISKGVKPWKFGTGAGKRRVKAAATGAVGNKTSVPGENLTSGGKFNPKVSDPEGTGQLATANAGYYGAVAGIGVGTVASPDRKPARAAWRERQANQRKIMANSKQLRAQKKNSVSKARYNLITDVGTRSARRLPHARKVAATGAGAFTVGAGLGHVNQSLNRDINEGAVKRQKATLKRQNAKLQKNHTTTSAFGVDHG